MKWIFTHIYPGFNLPKSNPVLFSMFPYEIIERGFGLCDKMAWAFCSLVQQQGIPCNIVYLYPPGTATSNHTIVNLFINGQTVLADPMNGVVFENKKVFFGLKEINENPDIVLSLHPVYNKKSRFDFSRSVVFLTEHPYAFIPEMQIIQKLFNSYCRQPPHIYNDIKKTLMEYDELYNTKNHLIKIIYPAFESELPLPDRQGFFTIWNLPLRIDWPGYTNFLPTSQLGGILQYKKGRKAHLLGRYNKALKLYTEKLIASQNSSVRESIEYFLGLLYFDMAEYEKAVETFKAYISPNKKRRWEKHAIFLLARCYEKMHSSEKAAEYYKIIQSDPQYAQFQLGAE